MAYEQPVGYASWEEGVPAEMREDQLWTLTCYRYALFAMDIGWRDVTKLSQDTRTRAVSSQLYRALGAISANLAEGYGRDVGRDSARFYEYALGSAREVRNWYYGARHILGDEVLAHRMDLLTQIVRLLITMVRKQRGRSVREDAPEYEIDE